MRHPCAALSTIVALLVGCSGIVTPTATRAPGTTGAPGTAGSPTATAPTAPGTPPSVASPGARTPTAGTTPRPPERSGAFPPQPDGVAWPTDEWVTTDWPAGVDRAPVDAATDLAFSGGAAERVRAVIVVHGGAIVYERYSPNDADGPDVIMPSFSVAKSITSALIGVLVRDGRLEIDAPAPVPEWHAEPDDPRAAITVRHMLHMSTGIEWTDGQEPGSDLAEMFSEPDMAGYAADHPLEDEPGTVFEYNTGTSMLLARIIGDRIGGDRVRFREFAHAELFGKLGIDRILLGFDPAGTWQGGFAANTTARDFARFGLLYLRGGEWDGEQILPEDWIVFTRTPSPANREYGAHWWLDPARPEVLYAVGAAGQVITVDPAHDLVIVQLSTVGGELPLQQTEAILEAFAATDEDR